MDVIVDLFDKTLQEFLVEYNHSFKAAASYVLKKGESGINEVLLFERQVYKNIKMYEEQDDALFPTVLILYRIGLHTKKLNKNNKKNTWEYIKNMYLLATKLKILRFKDSSKVGQEHHQELEKIANNSFRDDGDGDPNLNDIMKLTSSLFGTSNPELNDLLSSVTSKVTEKLKGKDLNSIDILELMNNIQHPGRHPTNSSSSLDSLGLSELIAELTEETKQKVQDGKINIEKLRESVNELADNDKLKSLSGSIPGLDFSKLQNKNI